MVDKSPQIAGNPSALPEAPAGNRALEDYQPQLMLLEQQNKNPLSKARQQPANIDRMSQSELKALRDYQMQILLLEDHKTRQAAALGDQVDGHTNARNPPPFADDKEDSQNAPKASLRSLMRCSDQGSYYLPSGSEEEWDRLASDAALPQSMGNLKLDNSESSNIGGSPQGIKGCGSQLSLDRPSPSCAKAQGKAVVTQHKSFHAPHDMNAFPDQSAANDYSVASVGSLEPNSDNTAATSQLRNLRAPHDMNALPEEEKTVKSPGLPSKSIAGPNESAEGVSSQRQQELQWQVQHKDLLGQQRQEEPLDGVHNPHFAPASFEYDQESSTQAPPSSDLAADDAMSASAHLGFAPASPQQQFAPASFEYNWIPSEDNVVSRPGDNGNQSPISKQDVKCSESTSLNQLQYDSTLTQLKRLGLRKPTKRWATKCLISSHKRSALRIRERVRNEAQSIALPGPVVFPSPLPDIRATATQKATNFHVDAKDISVYEGVSLVIGLRVNQ